MPSPEMQDMQTAVAELTTVKASVILLLETLATRLVAAAGDKAAIVAIAADVRATKTALADAVTKNTPAEGGGGGGGGAVNPI